MKKGLYLHFKAIAEAVSIPCIPYNIESRSGVNLENETLVKLMREHDNIVRVKEASGSLEQMKKLIELRHENYYILCGDDTMTVDLIEAGGNGVVSVVANLVPQKMKQMVHSTLEGNIKEERELEKQLQPFFRAAFIETNPIPIKKAMAMKGWCRESFRLPICSISGEENYAIIREVIAGLEIPEAGNMASSDRLNSGRI